MGDRYYPEFNEKNIKAIQQLYDQNTSYFDHPDCPYSEQVKQLFKIKANSDFDNPEIYDMLSSDEYLIKEINSLYGHLQTFGENMRNSDNAAEKNTYFKLSAALLEKLISMRERTLNFTKMAEFTETVLQIMEDELDVDTRSRVLERLNATLN